MMENNTCTVIVPIYNAEIYLKRCIDSILNQTYINLQVILVDDGSTDTSAVACNKFALKDNRIRVIHKKNGGSISARKCGLQQCVSKYVIFVDSDDWLESDYIERLVHVAEKSDADVVAANLYFDIGDSSKVCRNFFEQGDYTYANLKQKMIFSGVFFEYGIQPHLHTKLFKRSLLEQVIPALDDDIIIGEDAAIVYACIHKAYSVYVTDICGYHYVQHPNALTKTYNQNESRRLIKLICLLRHEFHTELSIQQQLNQYEKYLFLLRDVCAFDTPYEFLKAYGSVKKEQRIIVYGAGGMGQQLVARLKQNDLKPVAWLDKNFDFYNKQGLNVRKSDEIQKISQDKYDLVLIAVIEQPVANAIRAFLLKQGVPDKKIRWFDTKILDEKYSFNLDEKD